MKRPSSTASAITRASSELARMASSLPGIGYCTSSGSTLVSTTATTGMPSLLASVTAMRSFLVSSTKIASGRLVRPRRPPRLRCSFSSSRVSSSASFFGIASNSPGRLHALVLEHLGDALGDRVEVGEHAAEPALVDVGHAALLGVAAHRVLRLLLGADEHDHAAAGDEVADEAVGAFDAGERLLEIDDVDAVALAEDEALHLRVPAPGLVSEVDAGLEHLAHGDDSHRGVSSCG